MEAGAAGCLRYLVRTNLYSTGVGGGGSGAVKQGAVVQPVQLVTQKSVQPELVQLWAWAV